MRQAVDPHMYRVEGTANTSVSWSSLAWHDIMVKRSSILRRTAANARHPALPKHPADQESRQSSQWAVGCRAEDDMRGYARRSAALYGNRPGISCLAEVVAVAGGCWSAGLGPGHELRLALASCGWLWSCHLFCLERPDPSRNERQASRASRSALCAAPLHSRAYGPAYWSMWTLYLCNRHAHVACHLGYSKQNRQDGAAGGHALVANCCKSGRAARPSAIRHRCCDAGDKLSTLCVVPGSSAPVAVVS